MSGPPIHGLSERGVRLLGELGFIRSERARTGLAARLVELGLPTHAPALELDALLGGLQSPRNRGVGWLQLGVWEELDDADERAQEHREALEESEILNGTWPAMVLGPERVVPIGGGCDMTYLAGTRCFYTHDRMLDEIVEGPTSSLVFLEQRLLAMALSALRLCKDNATWELRCAEVAAIANGLQLPPLPEACDHLEKWWGSDQAIVVRTARGGRLVGPQELVRAAQLDADRP